MICTDFLLYTSTLRIPVSGYFLPGTSTVGWEREYCSKKEKKSEAIIPHIQKTNNTGSHFSYLHFVRFLLFAEPHGYNYHASIHFHRCRSCSSFIEQRGKKKNERGAAEATESSISADLIQLSAETRVIFSGF